MNLKKYAIIDLHLHLDGALSPEAIIKVALKENIPLPTFNPIELKHFLVVPKDCKSLDEYLTKFDIPNLALQTEYGLTTCTLDLLSRLSNQGLKYVEIRMAPQLSTAKGLSQDEVVDILLKAIKKGKELYGIRSNLILCMMRGLDNKEKNIETIEVAKKYLGKGVVLLDLAGGEAPFPNELFKDEFALARSYNIPFTIHAGEARDASSVKSALDLGAIRIGHGIHAIEDNDVIDTLLKNNIPLEICPTSNLDTKAIRNIKELPIKEFLARGIRVTINTDDPTVSETTLLKEYELLLELGLNENNIKQITINSINSAMVDADFKKILLDLFE